MFSVGDWRGVVICAWASVDCRSHKRLPSSADTGPSKQDNKNKREQFFHKQKSIGWFIHRRGSIGSSNHRRIGLGYSPWSSGNGRAQNPYMPHAETLRIMRMMDDLRREWGVRYPADE